MTNFIEKATEFSRDFELSQNRVNFYYLHNSIDFLKEEVEETLQALEQQDDAEILDGAGDVAFIALNIIYKWGRMKDYNHEESTLLIKEVMNRICDANLSKKQPDGSVKFNDDGKVVKPDTFKAPTYEDIINE